MGALRRACGAGLRKLREACSEGIFKSLALVLTIILFCAIVALRPKWLNNGYDLNLDAIKYAGTAVTALVSIFMSKAWSEWCGDVLVAGLRFINGEKIFFFMEVMLAVKLVMLVLGRIFRGCFWLVRKLIHG